MRMRHLPLADLYLLQEWPLKVRSDRTVEINRLSAITPSMHMYRHRSLPLANRTGLARVRIGMLRHQVHIHVQTPKIRGLLNPFEVFPKPQALRHCNLVISQERLHRLLSPVTDPIVRIKVIWLPDQTICITMHRRRHPNSAHPSHHRTPVALVRTVTSTWTNISLCSLPGRPWQTFKQATLLAQDLRTLLDLSSHLCHHHIVHRRLIWLPRALSMILQAVWHI
jgi:hypothetical protein